MNSEEKIQNKLSYKIKIILISNILSAISVLVAILFYQTSKNSDGFFAVTAIVASAFAGLIAIISSRLREQILRKRRVFIIYSNQDKKYAEELVTKLREHGYNPWFDADEIFPGQKWHESIMKGLSESAVALYLSSEKSNSSDFISNQLNQAMSLMRSRDKSFSPIIPIRLDNSAIPESLRDIQHINIYDENNFDQLEKSLKRILG